MIVWGADVLARKQRLLDQPKHLLVPYLPVCGLLILLVVFQGDAGTAVVMAGIVAGVLWIVGAPLRVLGALVGVGALGVVGLFASSPNRMRRLAAFLDPTADLNGANDQSQAGMYAIASGGWWGVGLGASRQKWGSLPEAHTDFIFAVIGEEFGLFGSLVVLGLFLVLGYAGIRIATALRRALRPLRRRRRHRLVHDPGPHQPGRRAAAAPDRRRAAAAGLLRRLGAAGQPAGRRGAARLRPPRAAGPGPAGPAPRPAPPPRQHRRRLRGPRGERRPRSSSPAAAPPATPRR